MMNAESFIVHRSSFRVHRCFQPPRQLKRSALSLNQHMSVKSHRFFGARFTVLLFLLIAACSANRAVTIATLQNAFVDNVVAEKTARTLDCRKANEYSFVVVANPKRKRDSDPLIPKDVNIVVADDIISKIELPRVDSEVKNFSLNSIEKTRLGFEMKVDWGGGLYHYEIQFNFRCKGNKFYLYKVKKESFSTRDPDSGNFLDKKESKVTKIEPHLPIEKFVITDYL